MGYQIERPLRSLIDFGIVSMNDKRIVIDRNKIRRHRQKMREAQLKKLDFEDIQGLYFDGRKDITNSFVENKIKKIKEEHISFVQQPHSLYIGHKTTDSGSAESAVKSIDEIVADKSIRTEKIKSIGSDGMPTNTGHISGVIRRLELKWKRPLQWNICLLHLTEIPLKALILLLDGTTKSPTELSGPIGKRLPNVLEFHVVKFQRVEFAYKDKIQDIAHTLSSDQRYLFDICSAISNGVVPYELVKRSPGTMSHARWLTKANRILRLYIGELNPSSELQVLVKYIIQVYAPMMFEIKHKHSVVYGPVHLANMLKMSRFLEPDHLKCVEDQIQRNAFYAHPEHILLAMINDSEERIRRMAWE